jgi:hypothetical protein
MPRRRNDRIDANQPDIVKALRKIPGVTVQIGMDDILVGHKGKTLWYEIKEPELAVSKRTGKINDSAKKDSQKRLEKEWQGHYRIVSSIDEILEDL